MRFLITKSALDFIKNLKVSSVWEIRKDGLYIFAFSSGFQCLHIKTDQQITSEFGFKMHASTTTLLNTGYYEILTDNTDVVLSIYAGMSIPNPRITFRLNSSNYDRSYEKYSEFLIRNDYSEEINMGRILSLYGLITSTTTQEYHAVDFSGGRPYFNGTNIKCWVRSDIPDKNDFSISKTSFWFLNFAKVIRILTTKTNIAFKKEDNHLTYFYVIPKMKPTSKIKFDALDNLTEIETFTVNVNNMDNLLMGLVADKHKQQFIRFTNKEVALLEGEFGSDILIPIPQIMSNFRVDVIQLKGILRKLSDVAEFSIFSNGGLRIRSKEIEIVMRWLSVQ